MSKRQVDAARLAHGEVDLVGQRFGKLVVVEFLGYENGRGQWSCGCDCGKQGFKASTSALRSGNTTSCRCRVDLTGKQFGDWTVESFDHQDLGKDSFWACVCICGETKIAPSGNIKRQGEYKCNHKASFIGRKFGRLEVKSLAYKKDNTTYWNCKCDCGNSCVVRRNDLTTGNTKSCGCLHMESISTHGMRNDDRYSVWRDLIGRCENILNADFGDYGARGIRVCEEWHDIHQFVKDMGPRPEGYEIERIDNNGNYCPDNCKWASRKAQTNNTRRNIIVSYKGRKQSLALWCEELNLNYESMRARLKRHWSPEEAFELPANTILKK